MKRYRIDVPLACPVTVAGKRHAALSLGGLSRRDIREIQSIQFSYACGVETTARMARVPVAVILALDEDDAERVGSVVAGLFDGGRLG